MMKTRVQNINNLKLQENVTIDDNDNVIINHIEDGIIYDIVKTMVIKRCVMYCNMRRHNSRTNFAVSINLNDFCGQD